MILVFISASATAMDDGQPRSILFEDTSQPPNQLTTLPTDSTVDKGDKCIRMLQEAEALKGKPQRRSTAMERYRQECELR
jgi:hypothetical protein